MTGDDALAIYPSSQKYEESRRVPFLTLFDRFRRALETPESITITCGYSYGDDHINEILFDSAERFPRSEVVALFRSTMPASVADRAKSIPNLTAIDGTRMILGTAEHSWTTPPQGFGWLWPNGGFALGEFTAFVRALSGEGVAGTNADA
jgi:hypothetical protein